MAADGKFLVANGRVVFDNGVTKRWQCPECRWWREWADECCPVCRSPREAADGKEPAPAEVPVDFGVK